LTALALTPLAQAVLDAVREAVVVFDADGRLVYANESGREAISRLGTDSCGQGLGLRDALRRRGARVEPLEVAGSTFGEAAYLPVAGESMGEWTLAARERQAIFQTLEATGWRLTESARRLGISRTTLWRRLKAYGMDRRGGYTWPEPS
jgi:transcriptional regulator of acetoin/glycerol metabolism